MIICKVWDADYPWDVRVEKVCHSLQHKHRVHLVCRNAKRFPTYEERDGIAIHRLPCLPRFLGKLGTLLSFPVFFNPLWLFMIWRTVRQTRADLILVRDLPLTLTALVIGRWFGIPVVLDMAENYPEMLRDLGMGQGRQLKYVLVRNPALVRFVEKLCVRYVDHIIVVVEESRERLLNLGVPFHKLSLVLNTPVLERLLSQHHKPREPLPGLSEELTLIYLGLLELPRGVDTVIRAMPEVLEHIPQVKLLILGSGRDMPYFQALAAEMGVAEAVEFLGWVEYKDALAYVDAADIGLIPHYATASWNTTIPNKLFDYMSVGKPMIVSNAKPTERIVREEACGIIFENRNAKALAEAIVALAQDEEREKYGRRGQRAIMQTYNWSVDENRLLAAMENAVTARGAY